MPCMGLCFKVYVGNVYVLFTVSHSDREGFECLNQLMCFGSSVVHGSDNK